MPATTQNVDLMTLSDAELLSYGLPPHATLNLDPNHWALVLAHAKYRTCGSYPDPEKKTHQLLPSHGIASTNWAGNVTSGDRGTYRAAEVDFYVPTIDTSRQYRGTWASFWAGVGGDINFTSPAEVVQAGVDTSNQGYQYNESWYEVSPGFPAQNLPLSRLNAGDYIHIYVDSNLNNDGYDYFYIANETANSYNSYTLYGSKYFSDSESGECIVERLLVNGSLAPLARFWNNGQPANTMKFYSCAIYGQNYGFDGIGNWLHHYYYIVNSNNQAMASPGPIVNYGYDYPVTWYRST